MCYANSWSYFWGRTLGGLRCRSGEVKEAQPRQTEFLEQAFLNILFLDQCQLLGFHFAAICRQLAVQFAADSQHQFFRSMTCQKRLGFFIQNRQPPLEIFQIECSR